MTVRTRSDERWKLYELYLNETNPQSDSTRMVEEVVDAALVWVRRWGSEALVAGKRHGH